MGLGCQRLQLPQRPETVVALQAAAATGQGQLMALYERALASHGIAVAQILVTRSDLADRRRYQNASGTLKQLLQWGCCRWSMKTTPSLRPSSALVTTTPCPPSWLRPSMPTS